MITAQQVDQLNPQQMRAALLALMEQVHAKDEQLARQTREVAHKQALIDKLTHENATLKRLKFAAKSEAYSAEQRSLIEETLDADLAELSQELANLGMPLPEDEEGKKQKNRAKRQLLPANLPRTNIHHEPESTACGCGCPMVRMGEDVAERLDYQPGTFTVERHIRGKWACGKCQKLVQVPAEPHIIDKGIPTTGLLAQVLVAKFLDHLPLYRQEHIFERAGLLIARSTLAQWVGECGAQLQPLVDALSAELLKHGVLHADETPVAMLKPGNKKTHRSYIWSFCTTQFNPVKAVVYRFADSRSGHHVREFLGLNTQAPWSGTLVTDDYSGYKACFELGVSEAGCMAHARRKFHELWVNHGSPVGQHALERFQQLYRVEEGVRDLHPDERRRIRQEKARPLADELHSWMLRHRDLVPEGSATAKALLYSLRRWQALTRYIDDGHLPIDNNWVENQIRPIALGRANWLFAGSLRAGKRAAAVMSLLHSARINGHDPYAYIKDVLTRLPLHPNSRIEELLPHRWQPASSAH